MEESILNELERKVPVFKKWRTAVTEERLKKYEEDHRKDKFVVCTKLQTTEYLPFQSYKPLSINKIEL